MSQQPLPNDIGDADLLTRVGIALTLRLKHTPHRVNISVDRGTVTLRGAVPTFYDRQLAIEITRRVAGVMRVIDELTVPQSHDGQKTSSSNPQRQSSTIALRGAGTESARRASDATASVPVRRSLRFGSFMAGAATALRGLFLAMVPFTLAAF
jgi:hypothetical protein